MKALCVGESGGLWQTITLILKVRWSDLSTLHATEARESLELIYREQPDVVMLHFDSAAIVDCVDFISQVRSFSDVPIIIFSQSDDVADKIMALEMGADDWVTPSTMPMELIAEVNAILRRRSSSHNKSTSSFLDGMLTIDYDTHEIFVRTKPVKLTPIEYKLICQLVKNEGNVVSSETLLHCGWGPDYRSAPEFLKKYIHRLRCKVEEDPAAPKVILTERGMGYRIAKS